MITPWAEIDSGAGYWMRSNDERGRIVEMVAAVWGAAGEWHWSARSPSDRGDRVDGAENGPDAAFKAADDALARFGWPVGSLADTFEDLPESPESCPDPVQPAPAPAPCCGALPDISIRGGGLVTISPSRWVMPQAVAWHARIVCVRSCGRAVQAIQPTPTDAVEAAALAWHDGGAQ